jgi:hypothetical protein
MMVRNIKADIHESDVFMTLELIWVENALLGEWDTLLSLRKWILRLLFRRRKLLKSVKFQTVHNLLRKPNRLPGPGGHVSVKTVDIIAIGIHRREASHCFSNIRLQVFKRYSLLI